MIKFRIISFISVLGISFPCAAINVGDITSIITSDKNLISKEVVNTTDVARFVGLKIQKITSPMEDGVVIPMENEVLSTPASLVLPGDAKEYFKIIYQGPSDDQERYYRLAWIDAPVNDFEGSDNKKVGQATTSAQINTILVVAPRNEQFNYKYDRSTGLVQNLGNSSFRVVSVGTCKDPAKDVDGKGCRERYYVMPNKSVTIKFVDTTDNKSHVGIWRGENFINVK